MSACSQDTRDEFFRFLYQIAGLKEELKEDATFFSCPDQQGKPLASVIEPDSAVPADAMSEEQTFRSEVNGPLPLSGHRSLAVQVEI